MTTSISTEIKIRINDSFQDEQARRQYDLENLDMEPRDMLAPRLTDWPGIVKFSVPGRPGSGFSAIKDFEARLHHILDDDGGHRWYYSIHGYTMPSRRLLYAIGCVYDRLHCQWLCMDIAALAPYIDSIVC